MFGSCTNDAERAENMVILFLFPEEISALGNSIKGEEAFLYVGQLGPINSDLLQQ